MLADTREDERDFKLSSRLSIAFRDLSMLRKPRRTSRMSQWPQRFVRLERLEKRELLAGDVASPAAEIAQSVERAAEGEDTSTVHFRFDYRHDTGFFNNHPERKALLEEAGQYLTDRLSDTLAAIPASNSNYSWQAHYTNPSNGANTKVPNGFSVAANEIVVFVGSRNLQSLDASAQLKTRAHADGVNTPFSYNCATGTQAQCDAFGSTLLTRGEGTTMGVGANDFAPFVGSISFDTRSETVNAWNFDDEPLEENQLRFVTFVQHELAHILGHGVADSFITRVSGGRFNGPKTNAAYVGSGSVPLNGEHIAQSVENEQSTIMTASINTPDLFSALDFAVLDDIGWQVTGDSRPTVNITTQSTVVTEGVGSLQVTATLSKTSASSITIPVSMSGAATSDVELSSTEFVFAANQRTATITIEVTDDTADETTEAVTVSLLGASGAIQGSTTDFRLTIFDDDGVDWTTVPRLDPAAVSNPLTIAGNNQASGIVFRATASQNLQVTASNVDQISEAVLLIDKDQEIIGQYTSTGLASTPLTQGEPYALIFLPRLTTRTFNITYPAGLGASMPWTNVLFPQDVNGNGAVSETDALQIINQLNSAGDGVSVDSSAVSGDSFYDVSGDQRITALDALRVINYLNNRDSVGSEPIQGDPVPPAPATSPANTSMAASQPDEFETIAEAIAVGAIAAPTKATATDFAFSSIASDSVDEIFADDFSANGGESGSDESEGDRQLLDLLSDRPRDA
ncbi:extracellular nuclease [Rhodopirellula sallentina SM41]|uniref:Extracellular nuclease n=2 Tax=Rhodopirellula TaxID=265488 RepID=M5TX28_9BACT|nr:extracellular nuclease [Rhodopirellula sallentina SM41]